MTTIQETVDQSLRSAGYGSYSTYARPVVDALVTREQGMFSELLVAGRSLGASESQVRDALIAVGMAEPVAAPIQGGVSITSEQRDALSGLREKVNGVLAEIDGVLNG